MPPDLADSVRPVDRAEPNEAARLSAPEIFATVREEGRDELERALPALAVSGFAAGLTLGLTALGAGVVTVAIGERGGAGLVAGIAYPLGFVAVIVGRMQLFTENTVYPVAVVLHERRHVVATARLWGVVLGANLAGALAFALLATQTAAFPAPTVSAIVDLGAEAAEHRFWHVFWSAVAGGWLIALVAWLVAASRETVAQIAVTVAFTFLVGVAHLSHSVASATEVLAAVLEGPVSGGEALAWLVAAVLGNAVGGVVIVSLLNYGQVHAGEARGA
jgi:formate/nitrite transporter FocA (FNT family)